MATVLVYVSKSSSIGAVMHAIGRNGGNVLSYLTERGTIKVDVRANALPAFQDFLDDRMNAMENPSVRKYVIGNQIFKPVLDDTPFEPVVTEATKRRVQEAKHLQALAEARVDTGFTAPAHGMSHDDMRCRLFPAPPRSELLGRQPANAPSGDKVRANRRLRGLIFEVPTVRG